MNIIEKNKTGLLRLKKHEKNPIFSPNPDNYWENIVVCNPGVWYENGKFSMLYRAAGDDKEHFIRFGLAESTDGVNFTRVSDKPVFSPSIDGPDMGGVEDPRIAKFGDEFYVTYAYRPFPPGQYWKFAHDVILLPESGEDTPLVYKNNVANSGLAISKDLKTFKRLGRITTANLDDRDVILFPEKINGKFAMLHRPKEWIGKKYGTEKPAIWIRFTDDLMVWEEESTLLISGINGTWEEKVGGSTPPLKTKEGWLVIYHGVENGGLGYYRAGAALLDLDDPTKVIGRLKNWIMEPEHDYEIEGYYKGCVFPTGNVIIEDTLHVYYGAADKYIGLATCSVNELLQALKASND
ncbi:glycosidase [Polaribacter sp. Q13]|uniref:glycoside hydrolase family 130 protein n=1 Tax=Polaribacter sp. Q13 TaxID=2806551 RepID=UPI00193C1BC3|nr:glycosidase [Polaribacter sp. Q13]QVY66159.1 glycosidase [Polaribacter sp. Q13]